MTSDEIKQVREAARRLRNGIGFHPEDKKDIDLCTDLVSTVIPADFDQPVTEELVESFGFEYSDDDDAWCIDVDEMKYEMHKHRNNVWSLCWDEIESWPHDIHCCYQFRLLAAALGIPKKGKS